jgi:hypothetical protein
MFQFYTMPHKEITSWLNSAHPNFKRGVYLLKSFSNGSPGISPAILKSDTSFSRKKLIKALQAINEQMPENPSMKVEKTEIRHKYGHTDGYPDHLKELERQIPILNSELNGLANQKHSMPEGDELRDLALDIVAKYKQIRSIWEQLDHFAKFGTELPGSAPENDQMDLIDVLVKWLEIQPALIDYSRRHKNSKDPMKKKEAQSRQAQLDEIQAFIKTHQNARR